MAQQKNEGCLPVIITGVLISAVIMSIGMCSAANEGENKISQKPPTKQATVAEAPLQLNPLVEPTFSDEVSSQQLLNRLRLKIDTLYNYQDFYDLKRKNRIGESGEYEFLKCSVVHDTANPESVWDAASKSNRLLKKWELFYYKRINQTWLMEITRNDNGSHSWVRIVKAVKGRDPDLNVK